MTKEEIIEESKICYDNCKLIISGLGEITKELDDSFDIAKAQTTFDMLLQSLMFSQAIADGNFCEEEKAFITNISKDNDLFNNIDSEKLNDLTWEKVFAMSSDKQKALSEELNEILNRYADDFVLPFAVLDAATTQNSLLDLSTQLTGLSTLLASVDGELTEEEIDAFQAYSDDLIVGKWADIKGLTEIILEDPDNADDSDDSDDSENTEE